VPAPTQELLQGTLDVLVLKILALGPNHGWGIANRLRQISGDGLATSQGSLYPALHRLELRGDVRSEMKPSENNRRARVYTITPAGRRRLREESASWEQFVASVGRVLRAT
jgi:transcriptional regulator